MIKHTSYEMFHIPISSISNLPSQHPSPTSQQSIMSDLEEELLGLAEDDPRQRKKRQSKKSCVIWSRA